MVKKKRDEKQQEVEQMKSQLARALADYDNLKKRTEEQGKLNEKIKLGQIATRLIPILDMLNSAQTYLKDPGLQIVVKEFQDALVDSGIEEIKVSSGEEFNPLLEEVVETLEHIDQLYDNKIAEVILPGWKIKGEPLIVVRPAKVKVYKTN